MVKHRHGLILKLLDLPRIIDSQAIGQIQAATNFHVSNRNDIYNINVMKRLEFVEIGKRQAALPVTLTFKFNKVTVN